MPWRIGSTWRDDDTEAAAVTRSGAIYGNFETTRSTDDGEWILCYFDVIAGEIDVSNISGKSNSVAG